MKKSCKSQKKCYYCQKTGHNSALCYAQFGDPGSSGSKGPGDSSGQDHAGLVQHLNPNAKEFFPPEDVLAVQGQQANGTTPWRSGLALLESAVVRVKGLAGTEKARLVFDNGSMLSFIRSGCARKLRAKVVGKDKTMLGRFGDGSRQNQDYTMVQVSLQLQDGSEIILFLRRVDHVSAPMRLVPVSPEGISPILPRNEFADLVTEPENAKIDILIGLDHYYDIVGPEVWRCPNGVVVKQTAIGKILTGYLKEGFSGTPNQDQQMIVMSAEDHSRKELWNLERFWRNEEIGLVDRSQRSDDELAVELFNKSVKLVDGRYEVRWPFKDDPPDLPSNYDVAYRRLVSVYRRLHSTSDLLETYSGIFQYQLDEGIVEQAPESPDGPVHYLPHHAVVIPTRETTKVRVVFDASSKPSPEHRSLNESMLRGPVFLNDLVGLLLRFRLAKFAVTCDVEKAFLQISLSRDHRDCTRFLWLKDPKLPPSPENLIVLRYTRVLFGATASPFLLAATIIHHMKLANTTVSNSIMQNTYMDNVIGGCNSLNELTSYREEAKLLFDEMSMHIHQWYSNNSDFMKLCGDDGGKRQCPSVLGLKWCVKEDTLSCQVGSVVTGPVTKRAVLGFLASVYDPCGFYSPVLVTEKILMQELWKRRAGWDEAIPSDLMSLWEGISSSLEQLRGNTIPRAISAVLSGMLDQQTPVHLHVFCDASSKAYCACVYILWQTPNKTEAQLAFAKARVAPVKPMTIPKLELTACWVGSKLIQFVEAHLKLSIRCRFLWTDSLCALSWIRRNRVSTVFVENRVRPIREVPGLECRYVPSEHNPADIGSRGVPFDKLQSSELWWNGPNWLVSSECEWPEEPQREPTFPKEEAPQQLLVIGESIIPDTLFDLSRFSSLQKLLRATARVFRMCRLFKREPVLNNGPISATEIQNALKFWEKRIQHAHFLPFIRGTANSAWKSYTQQLGLFVDPEGIIRCKGRFQNSQTLSDGAKYPILLPRKTPFTTLVINDMHRKAFHFGVKHTLAKTRERYWIPQGRSAIKTVLLKCQICRIHGGGHFPIPKTAPLPSFRISAAQPFQYVGLDYLGPLFVREGTEKKKVWVTLFTCAAIRAVHLEVVSSLSAQDFLLGLRRFVSMYRKPSLIVSDNARQFKLADRMLQGEFRRLSSEATVTDHLANQGITWKFIVERAPWMGGFYERLVGTVKEALKKTLGSWTVNQEELQTICYEIRAVINGRPLLYSEDDPSDKVLSPADLMFKPSNLFPDGSGELEFRDRMLKADELLLHWRAGQNLLRQLWDSWIAFYLPALRETFKDSKSRGDSGIPAKVGVVVMVKENLPRGQWKVGRITSLRTSQDGQVRAAEVRLPSGSILNRPLKLLYPTEGEFFGDSETNDDPSQKASQLHNTQESQNQSSSSTQKAQNTDSSRPVRKAAQIAQQKTRQMLDEVIT